MEFLIILMLFIRVIYSTEPEVKVSEAVQTNQKDQPSFCHKVIPLRNDSITWYKMMTNITEIEISVVGVMDLYLREGSQPGELEAIFKNVNFTTSCYPNICTESVQSDVERMQERMERCILSVQCYEDGTFRAWYPKKGSYDKIYEYEFSEVLYWMPFRFDKLKEEALEQNLTVLHKPVLGVNSQFQCVESFNFEYDAAQDGYQINSYSNDTACATYPPGRIFLHTVNELVDKTDLTVRKWSSNFTRTVTLGYSNRRTLAQAELNGFLSVVENKRIFENRNVPKSVHNAALDLTQLVRFKDSQHDTKMRMKAQVWDWNLEIDLLLREISDQYMVMRAMNHTTDENHTITATAHEDLVPDLDVRNIILKPAISGFNASGVLLFDFLGDIQLKHLAPRHNINLILKSTRIDIDSIEQIKKLITEDDQLESTFTTNFTVPWSEIHGYYPAKHEINCTDPDFCNIYMTVDAHFTLLEVKSTYELFIKHRINKKDLRIESYEFSARIADEGKFDIKLIDLELNFVEYVPKAVGDQVFVLYDDVIDKNWFLDTALKAPFSS